MTDRLYLDDSTLLAFDAAVRETRPHERGVAVWLDRTAFYPTAGGQLFDTGTLGAARVLDVVEDGSEIVHVCDVAPGDGLVRGTIDAERRRDHMQQHSGQHLLSAILDEHFRAPTVSFHMGEETCTIDLDVPALGTDALTRAEELVNARIWDDLPVRARFVDDGERATLRLRKDPAVHDNLRVVSMGDVDHSACGGTHVRATGEIGAVHLLATERVRQTTRLTFVCGMRALRHARARREIVGALAVRFTTRDSEIGAAVDKLDEQLRTARKMADTLTLEVARADAATVSAPGLDVRVGDGWTPERAAEFAKTVASRGVACAVLVPPRTPEKGADLLVAVPAGGPAAGGIVREVTAAFGGKGGGAAEFARGALGAGADLTAAAAMLRAQLGG